jgi:hypothetical protein
MSKAKPPPKQLSTADKLKVLKKNKLWSGSTKVGKGGASGAQKRALRKFANDIPLLASGHAKTISVAKVKKSERPKFLRGANNRVIIPTEPGERIRVNPKTGEVTSIVYSHGRKYRRHFHEATKDLSKLPTGKNYRYQLQFKQWGVAQSPLFSSVQALAEFMADYDPDRGGTFEDWEDFINVLELVE